MTGRVSQVNTLKGLLNVCKVIPEFLREAEAGCWDRLVFQTNNTSSDSMVLRSVKIGK